MKKQLSEEQLDQLMSRLITAAAADETTIAEISAPATWWGVQRRINEQKEATVSAWPPVGRILRWLMIGVPAAVALLIISIFVFSPAEISDRNVAAVMPSANEVVEKPVEPLNLVEKRDKAVQPSLPVPIKPAKRIAFTAKTQNAQRSDVPRKGVTMSKVTKKTEIKTDFIALSYALDPESGQIVRVKVPSSMMVSLGLVASVQKPSDLVDAEVLVGDDGLSRAIRFIR